MQLTTSADPVNVSASTYVTRVERNEIIRQMALRGYTQKVIALRVGVSRSLVSWVICGPARRNPRRWLRRTFYGIRRRRPVEVAS